MQRPDNFALTLVPIITQSYFTINSTASRIKNNITPDVDRYKIDIKYNTHEVQKIERSWRIKLNSKQ